MHQGLDHHHNIPISMHIGGGHFLGGVAATEAKMVQQYCLAYLPACLTLPMICCFCKTAFRHQLFVATNETKFMDLVNQYIYSQRDEERQKIFSPQRKEENI